MNQCVRCGQTPSDPVVIRGLLGESVLCSECVHTILSEWVLRRALVGCVIAIVQGAEFTELLAEETMRKEIEGRQVKP